TEPRSVSTSCADLPRLHADPPRLSEPVGDGSEPRFFMALDDRCDPNMSGRRDKPNSPFEAPKPRIGLPKPLTSGILNNWVRHWEVASLRHPTQILAAPKKPPFTQSHQVVEVHEDDQHHDHGDADSEPDFLNAGA